MKRLLLPLLLLALTGATLAGCGQKGPLYLPDDERAAKEHSKDRYEF